MQQSSNNDNQDLAQYDMDQNIINNSLSTRSEAINKIIRWLMFTVLLGILPILVGSAQCLLDKTKSFNLAQQFAHGELFLISIGIISGPIGEMIGVKASKFPATRIFIVGCAFTLYGFQIFLFNIVSNTSSIDLDLLKIFSLGLFIASIVIGLAQLILSEVGKK